MNQVGAVIDVSVIRSGLFPLPPPDPSKLFIIISNDN